MIRLPIRKFSTSTQSTTRKLRVVLASTAGVVSLSSLAYLYFNDSKSSKPKTSEMLRLLPAVQEMVSIEKSQEILSRNERSFKSRHKHVARIDFNDVASNNPGEDTHSLSENSKGIILGVFDGHGGGECSVVVGELLASYVAAEIDIIRPGLSEKENITQAMKDAFVNLDHDITMGCIPPKATSSWMSMNPFYKPFDYASILKGIKIAGSGSCAIVAYLKDDQIYVASTGDCRAVLGRKMDYEQGADPIYQAIELSKDQTATTPTEFSRMCEGDARYKWPLSIQEVVTKHLNRRIPPNYNTPPYVTALPEVTCYVRDVNDHFLILACDGLWDDLSSEDSVEIVKGLIGSGYQGNYATALMKAGMSAYNTVAKRTQLEDVERIRHHFSIPAPTCRRYRDDMTVEVVMFGEDRKGVESLPEIPTKPVALSPQIYKWVAQLKNQSRPNL